MPFFSLTWSLNDFKVKYAWITVKKYSQKKNWGQGLLSGAFSRGQISINAQNNAFWDPLKIPSSHPITPKFC